MLKEVGRESEYTEEEIKPLEVRTNSNGKVLQFPEVGDEWHVACAYDQWGLKGMAKMIICETLDDMNDLVQNCHRGGAFKIRWHAIADIHFVNVKTLDKVLAEKKSSVEAKPTPSSSSIFKAAPSSPASEVPADLPKASFQKTN